jgi:hypothetical protein
MSFCDNQYFSSRGKTRLTHFFQWSSKVLIWSLLKEKSIVWMDKSQCIHASAAGGRGHRPSHVVEAAPASLGVPSLGPHDQSVPGCASVSSSSPERLFSSVGLVKSDLWGSLLDTTLIDVMWAEQAPWNQLEREQEEVHNHQDIHTICWHTTIYVTGTRQYM